MWLDSQCQPEGFFQKQFDASPFGNCYVTIDPNVKDRSLPATTTVCTSVERNQEWSPMASIV